MTDKNHNIVFNGDIAEGFTIGQVKKNMSQLFKTDPAKIAALFSGQRAILKKNIDQATALKYKQVLLKAGALVDIQLTAQAAAPSTATQASSSSQGSKNASPVTPQSKKIDQAASTGADWSIAPTGSELLAEDERSQFEPLDIDLKHISMVSAFANTEESEKPAPLAPDVTHISVADVGTTIGEPGNAKDNDVNIVDLDATLAPAGSNIDPNIASSAVELDIDISSLSVAPLSEDGLYPERLEPTPPPAPDTSHLSINDDAVDDSA